MWAQLKAAAVEQENQVSLMQIDMMQLQVLQTQMDNIMLQSTLVVGFAIGLWGGETLAELVKDTEEICIWKTTASLAFGHLYFYNVAVSISCGVIIVICVSYLKQASQQAALTVNTGAAIAMTRHHRECLPPAPPARKSFPRPAKPSSRRTPRRSSRLRAARDGSMDRNGPVRHLHHHVRDRGCPAGCVVRWHRAAHPVHRPAQSRGWCGGGGRRGVGHAV